VDAVYVANMGGGMLQHQSAIASSLVDRLSLLPAAAETVENGPASAVRRSRTAAGGRLRLLRHVLVVGGEKMREVTGWRATDFVATMTHPTSRVSLRHHPAGHGGHVHPPVHGKYGVTREHAGGGLHQEPGDGRAEPYAHVEMALTKEGIFDDPARGRQQPGVSRSAAPVRRLPGERWGGSTRPLPAGEDQESGQTRS
jgi:acetyl-CoA C-acetyltransferase